MSNIKQWNSLTQQLRKVLDELPSATERDELVISLRQLVSVLEDLGKALGALPTAEEASKAKESLAKLESIVGSNPLLRGRSARSGTKPQLWKTGGRRRPEPSYSKEDTVQLIDQLSRMSEPVLRHALQDSVAHPSGSIRAMLTQLGRRVPTKVARRELEEQLAAAIINKRTYEGLKGDWRPDNVHA